MVRSLLFSPSNSERKIAKAMAAAAGGVILDLEDSVAPAAKDMARHLVRVQRLPSRPAPLQAAE